MGSILRPTEHRAFAITSRFIAALFAGYAAMVGLVALLSVLLVLLFGMTRAEALMLMAMIGVVGYAAIIIWSFAEPRLVRVWVILVGVAILSHVGAVTLAKLLPPVAIRPWAYIGG
jgi:hypothetical protein